MSGFHGVEKIDPDEIAREIASGSAAREALRRRQAALRAGRAHLVETTLAGVGSLRHMAAARRAGYRVVLHYVSVGSPDEALDRIRNRVLLGGHDVPKADVRRRFVRSHANLPAAIAGADIAMLYDNSDFDKPHQLVAVFRDRTWWKTGAVPEWVAAVLALAISSHST